MKHSRLYTQYLRSAQWKLKRLDALQHAGYRCARCHSGMNLEVHHHHYTTLGRERVTDLEVLCALCHPRADKERARAQADAHWMRRLDGWATKVYGQEWERMMSIDEASERFEAWLESREE